MTFPENHRIKDAGAVYDAAPAHYFSIGKKAVFMSKSHAVDMTTGPILPKVVMFVLPLMASSVLQLLFNAADVMVVGKFAGSLALAAVGSNGSLINLLVNVFISLSVGVNVLVARYFGSQEYSDLSKCVHSSIGISILLGIAVAIIGIVFSSPMLVLMQTDPEVLPLAALYLKIYFLGMPATLVYNFGAAVLRAVGDTKRPLRFLMIAGIINVILNLILVVVFHLDVAGVAIATVVSQYVSAFLVIRCLMRADSVYQLHLKSIRLHGTIILQIVLIGVPAGLQSFFFSFSNVIIQSSVNSFGYVTMAANSAAGNLDGFIYVALNSVYLAALSFTSQNYGAKRLDRIKRLFFVCPFITLSIAAVICPLLYFFGPKLLSLYISSSDPDRDAILATGMIRLKYLGLTYWLCGLMEVLTGFLRGLGKTWMPMIVSVFGACIFRVVWIYTVFAAQPSLEVLYLSYPISWIITPLVHTIVLIVTFRQKSKMMFST